ncbi:MAG: histidine phosphatase family protein [Sulfuricellaceae bacterium]|jgi:alpha-ribazole phosphatase
MLETLVDLLRHGEPEGGTKFRGWVDDPLSSTGWAQMRASAGEACHWDAVVTSPLLRCAEFAHELAAKHGLPVAVDEHFKEMGFGEWEGKTPAEVARQDAARLESFWRDPANFPPPGGESLTAVQARVAAGWQDLLTRHGGRRVLLVCHGGVIRLVLALALGIPLSNLFRLQVPFAALSRLRVDGEGESALPQLLFLGGRVA